MKADSLLPPARRGVPRGWGSFDVDTVDADVTDEAGGESIKPPEESW